MTDEAMAYSFTFPASIETIADHYEAPPIAFYHDEKSAEKWEKRYMEWLNRKPLREYLLTIFPEPQVDEYFAARENLDAWAAEYRAWTESFRGRAILAYGEAKGRVCTAWKVLREGYEG